MHNKFVDIIRKYAENIGYVRLGTVIGKFINFLNYLLMSYLKFLSKPCFFFFFINLEGDNIAAIQRHGTSSGLSFMSTPNTIIPITVMMLQKITKCI